MTQKKCPVAVDDVFGRWTIKRLELRQRSDGRNRTVAICLCECGTERAVQIANLLHKDPQTASRSCGCLQKEKASKANTTHGATVGYSKTRLYKIWRGMRERCGNPNAQNYRWYGAKGIKVDPMWTDFTLFRLWAIDNGYEDGLEIDRIENDRGYNPENCRWVTKLDNLANRNKYLPPDIENRLWEEARRREVSVYSVIKQLLDKYLPGASEEADLSEVINTYVN